MKFKKLIPYDILIRPTPNQGFIVEVGCVKVVYTNKRKMFDDLVDYIDEPEKIEKQYNDEIAKLGRIHISTYGAIRGAMVAVRPASQAQTEKELNENPQIVVHPHKEPLL